MRLGALPFCFALRISWTRPASAVDVYITSCANHFLFLTHQEWTNIATRWNKKIIKKKKKRPQKEIVARFQRYYANKRFRVGCPLFWRVGGQIARHCLTNLHLLKEECLFLPGQTISLCMLRALFSGVYFCLNMVMITMSTVLSCVVANMFFRGVRINRAPRWLRVVSARAAQYCHVNSVSSVFLHASE